MGTGVGEAMLISAAVGAGTGAAGSAISGGDPLKGALTGAAMGAVTGGIGSSLGGAAAGAEVGAEQMATQLGVEGAKTGANSQAAILAQQNAGFGLEGAKSISSAASQAIPNQGIGQIIPTGTGTFDATNAQTLAASQQPVTLQPQAPLNSITTPPPPPSTGITDLGYRGATPNVFGYGPQSNLALGAIGATSGLSATMQAERDKYSVPATEKYTGPLSRFKYDPSTYNPDIVRPPNPPYRAVYAAEGGIMSLAPNGYAMGGMPPQTNFANPSAYEQGTSQYSMATDPMSGNIAQRMADGGITSLGSYSDGGRLLKGPGDGMSDNIPAKIGQKQEARLADGEFVVPADVVSHLGNGSTDAGAKTLYSMMNKVRKARTGTKKQGRQIQASSYLPA